MCMFSVNLCLNIDAVQEAKNILYFSATRVIKSGYGRVIRTRITNQSLL